MIKNKNDSLLLLAQAIIVFTYFSSVSMMEKDKIVYDYFVSESFFKYPNNVGLLIIGKIPHHQPPPPHIKFDNTWREDRKQCFYRSFFLSWSGKSVSRSRSKY